MSTVGDRYEERIANVDGRDHCTWCCDDGMLPVALRVGGHEEYGPCPACQKGHRMEFGPSGSKLWPRGYWQGRAFGQIVRKQCSCSSPLADREEVGQWVEMVRGMSEKTMGTVDEGIRRGHVPAGEDAPEGDGDDGVRQVLASGDGPAEGGDAGDADADVGPGEGGDLPDGDDPQEDAVALEHDCPNAGRRVPWPVEECAACSPAEPGSEPDEEITL